MKKIFNKYVCVCLSIILVFSLTACTDQGTPQSKIPEAVIEKQTISLSLNGTYSKIISFSDYIKENGAEGVTYSILSDNDLIASVDGIGNKKATITGRSAGIVQIVLSAMLDGEVAASVIFSVSVNANVVVSEPELIREPDDIEFDLSSSLTQTIIIADYVNAEGVDNVTYKLENSHPANAASGAISNGTFSVTALKEGTSLVTLVVYQNNVEKLRVEFAVIVSNEYTGDGTDPYAALRTENMSLMLKEIKSSFDFFWNEAAATGNGAGLVRDRTSANYASIAGTGFGLALMPFAAKRGWKTEAEVKARVMATLATVSTRITHTESGFLYHFPSTSGSPGTTEVSNIDTAIFLLGAITCGEYFGGDVKTKVMAIYDNVNWKWYVAPNNLFYMGYKYSGGKYSFTDQSYWDYANEQLMLYVLGAGATNPDYRIKSDMMYNFQRITGTYRCITTDSSFSFIQSYFGALFTHQFTQAFIDFEGYTDRLGVDWFKNSVNASKASYYYCIERSAQYGGVFGPAWGISACDGPKGYNDKTDGLGTPPCGNSGIVVGASGSVTIAPYAAIASMPFTPKESMAAFKAYMADPKLQHSKYGLLDSYNPKYGSGWYASAVVGIDKGIAAVMLVNFIDRTVWDLVMQNENIRQAFTRLEITKTASTQVA